MFPLHYIYLLLEIIQGKLKIKWASTLTALQLCSLLMSSPEQLGSQGQSSRNSTTSWLSCSIISASILTGLLGIAWASQTQQLLELAIEKPSSECRCMSGDECWPSADEWSRFNASVNGRLITTLPIGAPCHDPTYNAEKCESLRQQWQSPSLQ